MCHIVSIIISKIPAKHKCFLPNFPYFVVAQGLEYLRPAGRLRTVYCALVRLELRQIRLKTGYGTQVFSS